MVLIDVELHPDVRGFQPRTSRERELDVQGLSIPIVQSSPI